MKWYNVEIPYNTREYIARVGSFREWLMNHHIKHETSGAGEYVHFEVFTSENMVSMINNALDTLVWFDSI
jgi:hypothetical protein